MYNLIKKDILIQKKSILFAIVYSFIIFVGMNDQIFNRGIYTAGCVAITYMLILGSIGYEEKNKSEIILNSLPVNRATIVCSKYLSVIVFILLSALLMSLSGVLLNLTGLVQKVRLVSFSDIVGIFISIGLLVSIYFPFIFKFGYTNMRIVNIFVFLFVFFAIFSLPGFITHHFGKQTVKDSLSSLIAIAKNIPDWLIGAVMILIVLIMMLISLVVSLRVYKNKEF